MDYTHFEQDGIPQNQPGSTNLILLKTFLKNSAVNDLGEIHILFNSEIGEHSRFVNYWHF